MGREQRLSRPGSKKLLGELEQRRNIEAQKRIKNQLEEDFEIMLKTVNETQEEV